MYTERGVPQGFLSSPMLFNVYIEELAEQLEKLGLKAFFYADDIAILAKNKK